MQCPNCGKTMLRKEIIRANVKGVDNVDLTYDAICPFCRVKMGQMFWGTFTPSEDLPPNAWIHSVASARAPQKAWRAPPAKRRICSHCGTPLPDDLNELPLMRQEGDRRRQDRRQGGERRVAMLPWPGPERRKHQRRSDERRKQQRRQSGPARPLDERRTQDRRKAKKPVLFNRRRGGPDRRAQQEGSLDKKT